MMHTSTAFNGSVGIIPTPVFASIMHEIDVRVVAKDVACFSWAFRSIAVRLLDDDADMYA